MNSLRLIFFVLAISLISCGDDDASPSCTQADWLGTYTGMAVCDGTSESTTVTITASGTSDIVIQYVVGAVTTTFDPLTVEGCTVERSSSSGDITASVSSTLDGDDLTLTEVITGGGWNVDCSVTATRQ